MTTAFEDLNTDESSPDETYFGKTYDTDEYDHPWRDQTFLTEVYESEQAPTYDEIADELECSSQTVQNWMPDDAQRGGPGLPYTDVAMFSGGYDSLVSTHYAMEKLDSDAVLHIDTETGIDENQQFVEDVCEWFGWPLEIVTPNKSLVEFGKEYGLPKAPSHPWIYRYLKEHPLSRFVTSLECEKPRFYTGVRKAESARRMENVSEEQEDFNGRWTWKAPIADFTEDDIVEYMVEHGLPRNEVVETIARSGECFCGAYADRFSELMTLKEHYPDHYEWIQNVENEIQDEIGTDEDHCYWGSSGMSSDDLQELMEHDDEDDEDMTLCVDCEGKGHRDFGHDQDPTYERIYVAGPRNDYDSYYETVSQYDTTTEWVNPFAMNEYDSETEAKNNADEVFQSDMLALSQCHGIVVRRISDYNLCGASMESVMAVMEYGIPVVVWNDGDDDVPLMLDAVASDVVETAEEAAQSVVAHSREYLHYVEGEDVLVK